MVNKFVKKWRLLGVWALILFSLLLLTQAAVMAQSSAIEIKTLLVELWPEYDRPETLVIYHVELAPSTALPAQVTFRLPGYLEKMHVVAVERDGVLVEVNPDSIELKKEGDKLWLSFSSPVPKIQFEYYDPMILTKQEQNRQLSFDFVAADEVEKLTVQVQQPSGAGDFSMAPAPSTTFTGSDGLKYHAVEIAGLAAPETATVTADYTRPSDELSAQRLNGENAEHAPDLAGANAEVPPNGNLTLGYTLMGVGAALLLGVGGYWWWSKRRASPSPATRGPVQGQKRKVGAKKVKAMAQTQAASSASSISNFCYRCGATVREEANFCHVCGAERRKG
jgi:hypothetical protein